MNPQPLSSIHFLGYKQRQCTDLFCLILFIAFLLAYSFVSLLAITQGNPNSLIQPTDSFGNICGQDDYQDRPYQLYFDISKCLTDGGLSLICPTRKLCVSSCPKRYAHYQSLNTLELTKTVPKSFTREQLICTYDFDPVSDDRTILKLVKEGLCAPYTIPSDPLLGRCLPSVLTNLFDYENNQTLKSNVSVNQINQQMFGVNSLTDVVRIMLADLNRIKGSLALFILIACVLSLLYMFAVQQFTGFIVTVTIALFMVILFVCGSFCWYTILSGEDLVYEYSTLARIVNDFIQLRTIYIVIGCVTTFVFCLTLILICTLFDRIRLSVILLDQAAGAVFSVLSTLIWSPLIILCFSLLTAAIIYVSMCLSTVGKPIFRALVNNQSVPCLPTINATGCLFQQAYGYDDLVLEGSDVASRHVIEFLVDHQELLKWLNLFAYLWFGAFLFALGEIVLAGVFSNYYWSKERFTTPFPLFYSLMIMIRYHLGSIAFGSLLIATLRYIRIIFEYITKKVSQLEGNIVFGFIVKCFSCFLWVFEKFLKFLNKNSYVLIAARGYSFCKATRKAFVYMISNCLRFLVLVNITEWILFCGIVSVCAGNAYLFYQYLEWTEELDQLILRWAPMVVIVLITYLIASLFFSVFDMAIKTLFICFLQDLDENDGSIQRPYIMNNELLRLVQKTNSVEKK